MVDNRFVNRRESLVILQDDFVEEFERRTKELTAMLAVYCSTTRKILMSLDGDETRAGKMVAE